MSEGIKVGILENMQGLLASRGVGTFRVSSREEPEAMKAAFLDLCIARKITRLR